MAKYSGKKHGVEVYDKTSINVTGEGPLDISKSTSMPKTSKIETFIGCLRRRPAMTIFVFFCIGAGLVLSGVFISKVLSPIEDVTTTKISVQSKLNCSAV